MPRLLYLFSLINLVIGSSAFVLASILEPLARDLQVSVAAAGQATTAYAVGTALLAPLLLLATGRWPRKHVLLLALALFTLGNGLIGTVEPPGAAAGRARADGRPARCSWPWPPASPWRWWHRRGAARRCRWCSWA